MVEAAVDLEPFRQLDLRQRSRIEELRPPPLRPLPVEPFRQLDLRQRSPLEELRPPPLRPLPVLLLQRKLAILLEALIPPPQLRHLRLEALGHLSSHHQHHHHHPWDWGQRQPLEHLR